MNDGHGLKVLAVDDEPPALDELAFLLGRDDRVSEVQTCGSATQALRLLRDASFDLVLLDIAMPGLSGLELARVLRQFRQSPAVVFVTAHAHHAVDAFDLRAVDYLLKPVHEDRLREAIAESATSPPGTTPTSRSRWSWLASPASSDAPRSVTRRRRATTCGCTPRPRTRSSGCRSPRSRHGGPRPASSGSTAACWSRSTTSTRSGSVAGRPTVVVAGIELPVSRRHVPDVREPGASYPHTARREPVSR